MTTRRQRLVARLADDILALPRRDGRRVAIDGVDGAGKTHLADELATELGRRSTSAGPVHVVRASADGFLHPAAVRHRRGRDSPQGYFRDSFDYPTMIAMLLEPLGPGGSGRYREAVYDVHSETVLDLPARQAPPGSVLVVDGIFTHRPELAGFWDYSVWLEVPFEVTFPRGASRGYGDPDPEARSNARYREGQRLYLAECRPAERATVVIDNTDLKHPVLTTM